MEPLHHIDTTSRAARPSVSKLSVALCLLAASLPVSKAADECIPLTGSLTCQAFSQASISTSQFMKDLFPFLAFVRDTTTFDDRLNEYVATGYSQLRYQQQIGCSSVNLTNTTNIYARYTNTVLCNALVQNSIQNCSLPLERSRPLCADSCGQFAISEQIIAASPELCGTSGPGALSQIRADLTNCALPDRAITGSCIRASLNEPSNCGYQDNRGGLCAYCSTNSPNATDACCSNANVDQQCKGVAVPVPTSMPPLFPDPTSTATPQLGLTGGQIAGIVVGSVLGAALILAAIILGCILLRRKRQSQAGSILNQPSPSRRHAPQAMVYGNNDGPAPMIPGARVARMAALEDSSTSSRSGTGAAGRYRPSMDDTYNSSPVSHRYGVPVGSLPKRNVSLSSGSMLGSRNTPPKSPATFSADERDRFSSPDGVGSGQSEQLVLFKDYYSQDEIRSGDTVAALWAYQPRANDEFGLERGDMLKVVGIWDDGWATGIKLEDNMDEWEERRRTNRDSGVSNGTRRSGSPGTGELKAFPLVCVCLPQHWRKTIDGESASSVFLPPASDL